MENYNGEDDIVVEKPKRSAFMRFMTRFINDDFEGIGKEVVLNVLVPGIFASLNDTAQTALAMIFDPDNDGTIVRNVKHSNSTTTYHNSYFKKKGKSISSKISSNYDDIYNIECSSKERAEDILDKMLTHIALCGTVSAHDFYTETFEELGHVAKYTDYNYGWTNLDKARVRTINRNCYTIDLPSLEVISSKGGYR